MDSKWTGIAFVAGCIAAAAGALGGAAVMTGKWQPLAPRAAQPQAAADAPAPASAPSGRTPSPDYRQQAAACGSWPPAAPGAVLVAVSAGQGNALSDLVLGDGGTTAAVAELEVEEGEGRLYVILSSEAPVLWRFSGDVARLDRVVVKAPGSAAAVAGVYADKACFAEPGAMGGAESALGRAPDREFEQAGTSALALPSGAGAGPAAGEAAERGNADEEEWAAALEHFGAAPLRVDPASVLSPAAASRSPLLPSHFGIAQLAGSGALRVLDAATPYGVERQYWGTAGFTRFPPSMSEGPAIRVMIPRDAAGPEGDPGTACLTRDTPGAVPESACR